MVKYTMAKLQDFQAKICLTAAGILIHDGRMLLVKHKKLGIWLAPGGHVEAEEMPHQAAEREFWEEAGVKVRAVNIIPKGNSTESEYIPNPLMSNLHWISQENYKARLESATPAQRVSTAKWSRGCEQHLVLVYLMEPIKKGKITFTQNTEESDDIAWFTLAEIQALHDTTDDIKAEAAYAFAFQK